MRSTSYAAVSEFFHDMALQSGVSEVADIVKNINDRLHQRKLVECEIVAGVFEEFSKMCGLFGSGRYEETRQRSSVTRISVCVSPVKSARS